MLVFNSTMVHSLPVLMNIVSNLLLHSLNVTESIQIWSNPFVQVSAPKITLKHEGLLDTPTNTPNPSIGIFLHAATQIS